MKNLGQITINLYQASLKRTMTNEMRPIIDQCYRRYNRTLDDINLQTVQKVTYWHERLTFKMSTLIDNSTSLKDTYRQVLNGLIEEQALIDKLRNDPNLLPDDSYKTMTEYLKNVMEYIYSVIDILEINLMEGDTND